MAIETLKALMIFREGADFDSLSAALGESKRYQCEVERLEEYEASLQTLERNAHDVCLLDYALVEDYGLRFLAVAIRKGCRAPLVVALPPEAQDAAEHAMEAGASDYLFKDEIRPSTLDRVLRYVLDKARLQRRAALSEERNALVARASNDGFWDWNLETDHIEFSSRWKAILGCQDADVSDSPSEWFDRVHPDDLAQVKAEINAHLEGITPHFQNEHRMRYRDGNYRWMQSRGYVALNEWGRPSRMVGITTDVHDRRIIEEQLRRGAFYDTLTSLPNRALFLNRLGRAIARSKRRGDYSFAVLFLDLDGFKKVNDTLGHEVGDQLLIAVARALETCLRATDTVARLGGDEFAVLIDDLKQAADATRTGERILQRLSKPFALAGREVKTSASIGVASGASGYDRPQDVLRAADMAMYRAKTEGKARLVIVDAGPRPSGLPPACDEASLRRAVAESQFEMHYQPIIRLESGAIIGFESLLRWRKPDGKLVSPAEFLPLAEDTGLIVGIDDWALDTAGRQLARWQSAFPTEARLCMGVNVSRQFLAREGLARRLEAVAKGAGCRLADLWVEVSISHLLEDTAAAERLLASLKDCSAILHMDEFGAGRSSLSRFLTYSIGMLKIDGAFVSNMDVRGENFEIVRSIIKMAQNLGMEVIAEGVETATQHGQLKSLRCEFGQGYFFSRPLCVSDMEELLRQDKRW